MDTINMKARSGSTNMNDAFKKRSASSNVAHRGNVYDATAMQNMMQKRK